VCCSNQDFHSKKEKKRKRGNKKMTSVPAIVQLRPEAKTTKTNRPFLGYQPVRTG
jgi:hypothetical protein